MRAKSEHPKTTVEQQSQKNKPSKLLEESIFFGNSFFLTGQNLIEKSCREKAKIEVETRNNIGGLSH
ncbi:hypothetical protein [Legionella bozemanae]|uniref:hypothetical protein n=1 Tax=Legionella bozemanae TaxID=447 RepID=UPI00399C9EAF